MISFGTLHSMDAEAAKAERHGQAFRAFRVECGLSLGDVARGWEISTVEVSELERGLHRFPDATALWNALQQLWFWKAEKHHG
jgi:predicted transcriptional regulator